MIARYRAWAARRTADRHLAHLARLDRTETNPMAEDPTRDPNYCYTCGRVCGSQPHR